MTEEQKEKGIGDIGDRTQDLQQLITLQLCKADALPLRYIPT